jgi:exopolyphosphatase/guanosine-5'-triphosphate,3'-diphosphate pyrophosphatase
VLKEPKRIAAIDIGTNSIHMVVAEAAPGGYKVVDREKEMVQLGLSSLGGQPLTKEAISRGVKSISRLCELAREWGAEEIVAVATSAVREAPNRREFLHQVRTAAGIRVRVISGEEEADFIFRAVRSAVEFGGRTALCIDIGGGSVEIIVGTETEIYFTRSEPLGSLRMAQTFSLKDSPAPESVAACRRQVRSALKKIEKRVSKLGFDLALGTSGTILTMAGLGNAGEAQAHGLRNVERKSVSALTAELASLSCVGRAEKFALDEKRSTSIVGGAIVLDEIMSVFGIKTLLACPAAMREGILESRIASRPPARGASRSLRRTSVLSLAERTACDLRHGRHVAHLAGRIFDQTLELHGLAPEARELLEYAALLHESGMHVSDRSHHKHSYYLIRHADLKGFTEEQLIVTANVARYYRKSPPSDRHPALSELTAAQRSEVEKLAAMLRVAEALDRGHHQRVRDVAVEEEGKRVTFRVRARANAALEMASAGRRVKFFSKVFGVRARFTAQ